MSKVSNISSDSFLQDSIDSNSLDNMNLQPLQESTSQVTTLYPEKNIMNGKGNKKALRIIKIIFALFLVLFVAWLILSKTSSGNIVSPFSNNSTVNKETKVMCDLTGEYFTEDQAAYWKDQRPFGVMINNHVDARPQSGLVYADLVYEIVAEGGITRFLAFFLSNTPEKIGPVRSTREYYLVLVKELSDAMIMHIGYSPQALIAIDTWPVRSLFRGGCESLPGCEWRDNPRNVAYEHTAFVNGVKLRELGASLGWEGKGDIRLWKFKDSADKYSQRPSASKVSIDFWTKGDYSSIFTYNQQNNSYLKYTGYDSSDQPIPTVDQETNVQVEVKNLIVQFATETSIDGDEKGRLEYQLVGSGKALVFVDGKVINATWNKSGRDDRTIFYDTDGNEVEFNRGKFWIAIVPDRNVDQVVYN
ncbi:DUF3048 domain-containing protein [candidate division WWE3 bacterium]|uniref:DUF3048 domain-containing protein n=1 Tax=candidate division WWE3 bacterium TaxID=2053526 RepID=A0A7X9E6H2_UNCKA|nr:DUF3048 domain-containing protein [candidate division WWE3 bacterium]